MRTEEVRLKAIEACLNKLGHKGIADALGYPDRRNVWPWTGPKKRPLPADMAPALERAMLLAGAEMSVERLCPTCKWVRVADPEWPHPKGRPLLDVAAEPDARKVA